MNNLIIIATFIPWIINFYANLLDIYRSLDYQDLTAIEWLKNFIDYIKKIFFSYEFIFLD